MTAGEQIEGVGRHGQKISRPSLRRRRAGRLQIRARPRVPATPREHPEAAVALVARPPDRLDDPGRLALDHRVPSGVRSRARSRSRRS